MRSNRTASLFTLIWLSFGASGVWLTSEMTLVSYFFGQILIAVFLFQSFVLLHEFGHNSLFSSKRLNDALGWMAGFFSLIPFLNWRFVHHLHHRWTGWRDKDPTTEKTFDELLNDQKRRVINVSWKYWIPLFTIGYRFGIYWNVEKLKRHLTPEQFRIAKLSLGLHLMLYVAAGVLFGGAILASLPAILLAFTLTDLLTLSQHSHIEMEHSRGEAVKPISAARQAVYTRSLALPSFVGRYLFFNVHLHEAHHAHPTAPCYELERLHGELAGKIPVRSTPFLVYVRRAKAMTGVDFIFKSRSNCDF